MALPVHCGYCRACGKFWYPSRKIAKTAARKQQLTGVNAYPCAVREGLWHLGHLPKRVAQGRASRESIQRAAREARHAS